MTDGLELLGTAIAGKYRLRRLVGLGGMGAVYEGEHVELGKRVAVKIIDAASSMSSELTTRFKREARAASAVESEHIVQVFDVGHDPDAGLFMVMEYLVGEDLEQRLRHEDERRLDPVLATTIGHQVARALVKAHAARVIHRDLKPANIFLTHRDDGSLRVKVLDFGISKLLASDTGATVKPRDFALTQEGVALGTPQYMSPEQAQGLVTIDHRTDIWSLGAVLYEAVAGKPAYPEAATYEEVIMKILLERPKPLEEIAPWVPLDLAAVIHDALQHDVMKRIPDCQTFANRLASAMPHSVRGSTGPFNVVRSIGKIEAAPQRFAPLGVRPSYSTPAAQPIPPADDTQVVIRASDGGPESFDEQSPSSATMIASAKDREIPAKVIVRASQAAFTPEALEADSPPDPTMFQPPAWVGGAPAKAASEGPSTLKTAVRSLTVDNPQTRGVLAAAATAMAIIVVGGGLMLLSRGEGSAPEPASAGPSVTAAMPQEPPPETVDPATLKAAAPPPTGTAPEPAAVAPPVASHAHAVAPDAGARPSLSALPP